MDEWVDVDRVACFVLLAVVVEEQYPVGYRLSSHDADVAPTPAHRPRRMVNVVGQD